MQGHAAQCVERYLELANKSPSCLRQVSTPCVDEHSIASENFDVKGELAHCCSRIVLKALFSARRSRPDTLWSVNTLARNVTKWTKADDQRLHRLISYLNSTQNFTQIAFVGDDFDDCHLALFADASFAGDLQDSKSTSGCFLALVGPRTFVPISWFTKKQTVISHSSSEAEVVALDAALRVLGLPCLLLWELILDVFVPTSPNTVSYTHLTLPTILLV